MPRKAREVVQVQPIIVEESDREALGSELFILSAQINALADGFGLRGKETIADLLSQAADLISDASNLIDAVDE